VSTTTYRPARLTGDRALLYDAVAARIAELGRAATDPGRLARLRRAVKDTPGRDPDVWEDTIGAVPEKLWGTDDDPSSWEWATHVALTLFAVHSQGGRTAHRRGVSLGAGARRLVDARDSGSMLSRFQAVAIAPTSASLRHHLRALVTLLRDGDIALDYAQLAVDLRDLNASPATADPVRLRWGRDYHRKSSNPDDNPTTSFPETADS
jgi:CRISPR system Cascade subunit CasB